MNYRDSTGFENSIFTLYCRFAVLTYPKFVTQSAHSFNCKSIYSAYYRFEELAGGCAHICNNFLITVVDSSHSRSSVQISTIKSN